MYLYIHIFSPNRVYSMGFSRTKGLVILTQLPGLWKPSKMCFPLGTYRHLRKITCCGCRTEVGRFQNMYRHNENEGHFLQMFTGPMKY